jgi:hypothetical protein
MGKENEEKDGEDVTTYSLLDVEWIMGCEGEHHRLFLRDWSG